MSACASYRHGRPAGPSKTARADDDGQLPLACRRVHLFPALTFNLSKSEPPPGRRVRGSRLTVNRRGLWRSDANLAGIFQNKNSSRFFDCNRTLSPPFVPDTFSHLRQFGSRFRPLAGPCQEVTKRPSNPTSGGLVALPAEAAPRSDP